MAARCAATRRSAARDPRRGRPALDDVERGSSQWEAADLAARMQRTLRERRGKEDDRGVRQDSQHVLLGATMPAVLVEVGFLDHPIEGKQLADPAVQASSPMRSPRRSSISSRTELFESRADAGA